MKPKRRPAGRPRIRGKLVSIQIRLSPKIIALIDSKIAAGKCFSRGEFIRQKLELTQSEK